MSNQNAPQVQAVVNKQVSINPLAMMDGEVREALLQMAQAITTQALPITAQANMKDVPRENQHATTMVSRLRDFTKMNPSMFFGYKVDDDPQDFLDEVYNILFAMGVGIIEKAELVAYQLKYLAQTWYN